MTRTSAVLCLLLEIRNWEKSALSIVAMMHGHAFVAVMETNTVNSNALENKLTVYIIVLANFTAWKDARNVLTIPCV